MTEGAQNEKDIKIYQSNKEKGQNISMVISGSC